MNEAMRTRAKELFGLAIAAADPEQATRKGLAQGLPEGPVLVVAVGKAARSMAKAALDELGPRIERALVVTNAENAAPLAGAEIFVAGHPVPDAEGARAAMAVEAAVAKAGAGSVVLALISGGGSALLPAPRAGLAMADKAAVNRLMLAGGLDIGEMNMVRQALSRLKGGKLAALARPAAVVALILSDVIGDDLRIVASGPTVAPIGTAAEAQRVLETQGLWEHLPLSVQSALKSHSEVSGTPADNRLVGSNALSVRAVAKACGGEIWSEALTGDVAMAARWLAAKMRAAGAGTRWAVCGGETTVRLSGNGQGGRNQELALRVAAELQGWSRPWVFLSGGTDGRDGPTDAAGGLVDGGTLERIARAGGDWRALLANNDSHAALALARDLVKTGGTGTNVADIQLIALGA